MKVLIKTGVVLLVMCMAISAYAGRAPKSAVFGSPHDFKTPNPEYNPPGGASYSLCNFCHIAHKFGAAPVGPGYLLWNHTLSSQASYGVYTSDSMRSTPADLGGQMTVSNLCLSCHDGTIAVDSWYEVVAGPNYQPLPQPGTHFMMDDHITRDLTKQHPINFTYPDATTAAQIGIFPAADLNSIDGNGNVPLFNGKMQCATCHDAHAGPSVSHLFFRAFPSTPAQTQTGTFCVYCHL